MRPARRVRLRGQLVLYGLLVGVLLVLNMSFAVATIKGESLADLAREQFKRKIAPPPSPPHVLSVRLRREIFPHDTLDAMIAAGVPKEKWGPSAKEKIYEPFERLHTLTGCNRIAVPFSVDDDARCIAYLSDPAHWEDVVPLPMEFNSRTIKFAISYRKIEGADGGRGKVAPLRTMLKVPQRLFPLEAYSEVAAFHTDRLLHVRRIPPTALICLPLDMLQRSVKTHAAKVAVDLEMLKESQVSSYAEWVEKDLFAYNTEKGALGTVVGPDGKSRSCVYASVQLRMTDVNHLLDTVLSIPYRAHSNSWWAFLNATSPSELNPDIPPLMAVSYKATLVHLASQSAFDYVIGNGDRSPNKNNFVVGGCKKGTSGESWMCHDLPDDDDVPHPGAPTVVYLDQGMAFYGAPKRSLVGEAVRTKGTSFCVFSISLLRALVEWDDPKVEKETPLVKKLLAVLPKRVASVIGHHAIAGVGRRQRELLDLTSRCFERHPAWIPFMITP